MVARWKLAEPDAAISLAFLEFAEPSFEVALSSLAGQVARIHVCPLFLFAAGHLRRDIPAIITGVSAYRPSCEITLGGAIGANANLATLMVQRIRQVLEGAETTNEVSRKALLLAGRGSSTVSAQQEFFRYGQLVSAPFAGELDAVAGFLSMQIPGLDDIIDQILPVGYEHVIVLPHLLVDGALFEGVQRAAARLEQDGVQVDVLPPLLPDAAVGDCLFEVMLGRAGPD